MDLRFLLNAGQVLVELEANLDCWGSGRGRNPPPSQMPGTHLLLGWVPWLGLIIDGTCFLGSRLECPLLAIQLVLACVSVSSREVGTLPGRMLDIWEAWQARVSLGASPYSFFVSLYKIFACLFVMFLFFPKQGFSV